MNLVWLGLNPARKSVCALLFLWLALAPASVFGETGAVSPSANDGATTLASGEAKSKAKSKTKTKAKPKVKSAKKSRSKSKTKPMLMASRTKRSKSPLVSTSSSDFDERRFDREVAAARQKVSRKTDDIQAREKLASASVILIDQVLQAEAVSHTGRARYFIRKLKMDLHDTGWRVQQMASDGDIMARQATGFLLMHGLLIGKDAERSCEEFLAAAEKFAPAAWHAAQCQMESSPDRASVLMEQAAEKGHAAAQEWLGRRCLGEFGAIEMQTSRARAHLEPSARQGRSSAKALLAFLLINGQGGPVDVPRAIDLYKAAAENGDVNAQNNLGELHETGRGVKKDVGVALKWYERAAEAGLGPAQFNAGRLWSVGVGGVKDPAKARALLTRAEGNGVLQAREVLDWLDQESAKPTDKSK